MPADRSRSADRPRNGYIAPVAQQGRVILDRDFNALQSLTAARIEADALDFVGPCGTPDDGFRISIPGPAVGVREVTSIDRPAIQFHPNHHRDFEISPGTMYLGGERVVFPRGTAQRTRYSYLSQPDWLTPPIPRIAQRELVYLHVDEQEVSAVEDPDLLEAALGGPDTTQRLKLLRRVARVAVEKSDCASAWDLLTAAWAKDGFEFEPATMRVLPSVQLKVGVAQETSTGNPCDPVASGGYLYSDNQLIRVQMASVDRATALVWAYDNASFLYRVATIAPDGVTLTLVGGPPDQTHYPQKGQLVEILTAAAVFGSEADPSNPDSSIPRAVAEATGTFNTLAMPYGQTVPGDPANYLVLQEQLDFAITDDFANGQPVFVRVWQAKMALPAAGEAQPLLDFNGNSTGLTVTLSGKAAFANGAYWLIAARPATPQVVYPEALQAAGQPPDGPRRWACPLAVIDWESQTVTDCRNCFEGLVALTRRKPGCCTVSVSSRDLTPTRTLQHLIDQAVARADQVTVCLSIGTYVLPEPLRLDQRHAYLVLEACGDGVFLMADSKATAGFGDGLIVIAGGSNITLRGLWVFPPLVPVSPAVLNALAAGLTGDASETKRLLRTPYVAFGVRAADADQLTLEGCSFSIAGSRPDETSDLAAAAVFLQGDCAGFAARDCWFTSQLPPTYTWLSAIPAETSQAALETLQAALQKLTPLGLSDPSEPSAAFGALIAFRRAAPATLRTPIVAVAGILALPHSAPASVPTLVPCVLGSVQVRDCTFARATAAIFSDAALDSLRLEDNAVTASVSGFWFHAPYAVQPENPATLTDAYYQTVGQFAELILLRVIAIGSAPPSPGSSGAPRVAARALLPPKAFVPPGEASGLPGLTQIAASQGTASSRAPWVQLIVRGNSVQSVIMTMQGTPDGSLGLLLWLLSRPPDGIPPPNTELVVSANVFENANGVLETSAAKLERALVRIPTPTVVLVQASEQACALTGNVITNRLQPTSAAGSAVIAPSLWIVVDQSGRTATQPLAITGNVLRGQSDIKAFAHAAPTDWSGFNADPT
jgi:hypothetical protein